MSVENVFPRSVKVPSSWRCLRSCPNRTLTYGFPLTVSSFSGSEAMNPRIEGRALIDMTDAPVLPHRARCRRGSARCTPARQVRLLVAAFEQALDLRPVGLQLGSIGAGGPGPQVGDDGWCRAEQGDGGAERQTAQPVGWEDRDPAHGALVGAGAVIAERHRVGELVTLPDQGREVLEVFGVRCTAEDDLH